MRLPSRRGFRAGAAISSPPTAPGLKLTARASEWLTNSAGGLPLVKVLTWRESGYRTGVS